MVSGKIVVKRVTKISDDYIQKIIKISLKKLKVAIIIIDNKNYNVAE
jgi:hypothetical protein